MDLDSQSLNVWIALGTLSAVGFVVATLRTWTWFVKEGKMIIDLPVDILIPLADLHLLLSSQTLGKLLFHLLGTIGTVIFLVMAGVSLWWLIFLKVVSETHPTERLTLACLRLNTMRRSSRRPAQHRISSKSCGSWRSYSKQRISFI